MLCDDFLLGLSSWSSILLEMLCEFLVKSFQFGSDFRKMRARFVPVSFLAVSSDALVLRWENSAPVGFDDFELRRNFSDFFTYFWGTFLIHLMSERTLKIGKIAFVVATKLVQIVLDFWHVLAKVNFDVLENTSANHDEIIPNVLRLYSTLRNFLIRRIKHLIAEKMARNRTYKSFVALESMKIALVLDFRFFVLFFQASCGGDIFCISWIVFLWKVWIFCWRIMCSCHSMLKALFIL